MAVETQTKASEAAQEVVVAGAAAEEKEVVKELPPPPPAPEAEEDPKKHSGEEAPSLPAIGRAVTFTEESNLVTDLEDPEKKALDEIKQLVQAALANHEFSPPPPPPPAAEPPIKVEEEAKPEEQPPPAPATEEPAPPSDIPPPLEEVLIWGIPLLGDERSETVLIKFLQARDLKVKEAMAMLKNAVIWRKEFGIEALVEEDLGIPEMEKVVFMHGTDRDGHPVCYNVYGEFQNKELYAMAFADEEKRQRFLRWRIQYLEKGIRQLLDFSPGGVCTMVQVTDLKNSIGPMKRELRQALTLLQDNYPEFAAKQIFVNVPWWYLAFNRMISPFFTQRSKSKFVFAGPSKTAETLFKYIAPEQVPVQYGGLSKENDPEFTAADAVTEITIKPLMKQLIEIPLNEKCLLVWELRVLGWDVTFGAEFVPSSEDGYTVIVQKARKLVATDEPVEKNRFKIGEAGKVVLTVDNTTSKKKKLLYRYKIKSSTVSL
ncbi:patellin-3 [Elaeis guineensis]|uniref:Patellin-3 n=1 Tax=Elaeis guineensis var. tenera TaxID=51953 RepID=A0A6I9RRB2_ELAGV|nr:patellin-3 [Elaeis guineensis]